MHALFCQVPVLDQNIMCNHFTQVLFVLGDAVSSTTPKIILSLVPLIYVACIGSVKNGFIVFFYNGWYLYSSFNTVMDREPCCFWWCDVLHTYRDSYLLQHPVTFVFECKLIGLRRGF